MPYLPTDFIAGFLKFINSVVLKYFASLFGASYLMDKARLEKNDLLALPCPFENFRDVKLLVLPSSESVDESILNAMSAGADFKAAFEEFSKFRRYFANAQIPTNSLEPASPHDREVYVSRLIAEIQSSFGQNLAVEASVQVVSSRQACVTIGFGEKIDIDISKIDITGQFLGSSIIKYDLETETLLIVKSPARYAWTIDQAVGDALALSREIRGGH
jgi:hypothetical protein